MAVTQAQWYEKLESWVPSWFLQNEAVAKAVFQAMAVILKNAQNDSLEILAASFLDTATGMYLDMHGSERSVTRFEGESDASYRARIKLIDSSTSYATLFNTVKATLNNGDPILLENLQVGFADVELFADAPEALYFSKSRQLNRFTVIIPVQEIVDDTNLKLLIVATVDEKKALGVFVDIVYQTLP